MEAPGQPFVRAWHGMRQGEVEEADTVPGVCLRGKGSLGSSCRASGLKENKGNAASVPLGSFWPCPLPS